MRFGFLDLEVSPTAWGFPPLARKLSRHDLPNVKGKTCTVELNDRESLEARKANPTNFGAHLRAFGWVIVVFVVVFSAFNLIEYRQHVRATSPSFATSQSSGEEQPINHSRRRRAPALRSLEWEVLIVGVGLGVWLFAARRHNAKVRNLKRSMQ